MQNVGTQPQGQKRGYKWKKWLAIYLAVGVIAYLVVYFVFFHSGGGYGGGGGGNSGGGGGSGYGLVTLPLFTLRYMVARTRRG